MVTFAACMLDFIMMSTMASNGPMHRKPHMVVAHIRIAKISQAWIKKCE